jgi:serine/threonine protein kinase
MTGTLMYMAPEIFNGDSHYTEKADILQLFNHDGVPHHRRKSLQSGRVLPT